MPVKTNRFQELDSLRGIAALSVVLFHFTFGYDNGLKALSDDKFYFRYGSLGVSLFFMISGFVIFMTLQNTKNTSDFIVSRFSRLYPAYWACIIVTVILTTALSVPFQQNMFNLGQILVNFSMFQYWFKIKDVDGAYWTLAIELTFYGMMYIVFLIKKQQHITSFCSIWLALSVLFALFDIPFNHYINVIFILKHAPLFVAGITFYLLKGNPRAHYLHTLVLFSLFSEYVLLYQLRSQLVVYEIITMFFCVFYLFIYDRLRCLTNNILLFFGSISYSLYLIHENIGVALIYWLKKVYDVQLFYLPISILAVVILASCITFYIEKPAMHLIRNSYKNRNENR